MNKLKISLFASLVFLFLGCTIIVPFSKNKVILMDCENGYLKAEHSYDEKLQKEVVTVTAVPDDNYICKSFSVVSSNGKTDKISNYTEVSDSVISFTLEEDDVYVTAIFVQIVPDYPLYSIEIKVNDSTYCSLNPSVGKSKEGDTVTFTNYSRSARMVIMDGFPKAYKKDGEEIAVTKLEDNKTYSFIMPAADVIIESKVDWIYYPIHTDGITGGSITVNSQAYENADVVFVLVPDEGKTVKENSVVAYRKTIPPVMMSVTCSTENALEYSFKMPADDVYIYAEFN